MGKWQTALASENLYHANKIISRPLSSSAVKHCWRGIRRQLGFGRTARRWPDGLEERSQAATEYLLLVALGLAVLTIAIAVVLELRSLADVITVRVRAERSEAIAMLVR